MNRTKKIAFEEHFMAPGFSKYSEGFLRLMPPGVAEKLLGRLTDIGELRLAEMDAAHIDFVILSHTGPSVQGEPDPQKAVEGARSNNEYLADSIKKHPARFGGFATLPMHDPRAAVAELTYAVKHLGFYGSLVNGHTQGRYYDDPAYDEFWACMQELDVPLYLHPTDAYRQPYVFSGHPELMGATWGWGVETGTHALRLLFGGVFDRFPGIKVVVGHMGEAIPYLRWRFDSRFAAYPNGVTLQRKPSEYFGSNILITTSGVCSNGALIGAIEEMGEDAVMFSVDYPFESTELAAHFIENAPVSDSVRAKVCHGNAEKLFKLKK